MYQCISPEIRRAAAADLRAGFRDTYHAELRVDAATAAPLASPPAPAPEPAGWHFFRMPDLSRETKRDVSKANAWPTLVAVMSLCWEYQRSARVPRVRDAAKGYRLVCGLHQIAREAGMTVDSVRAHVAALERLGILVTYRPSTRIDPATGKPMTIGRQQPTVVQLVVSQRHLRPEKGAGKVSTPPTGVAETFDHQTAVRSNPSARGRSNPSATCRDSSEKFTKTAVAGGGFGVAPPGTAMGDSSPEPQPEPEPALPPPSLPRAPRLPTEPAAGGYDRRQTRAAKAPSKPRQTPWITAGGDEPRPPAVWQGEDADAIQYTLEKDKERREKGQTSYSTYIPGRPAPVPAAPLARQSATCSDVDTAALKRKALADLAALSAGKTAAGPAIAKPPKRPSRARQKAH